jgi:CheY-like chemotaxis protein/anti-sigma regulatory factor (Ser/Thr protein kinase)
MLQRQTPDGGPTVSPLEHQANAAMRTAAPHAPRIETQSETNRSYPALTSRTAGLVASADFCPIKMVDPAASLWNNEGPFAKPGRTRLRADGFMVRRALVVEDDPDIGLVLSDHLNRQGFTTTLLTAGKEAVPWTRQNLPELILLDLMLPDVDGYVICENLKLDRLTNLIPVVMVTARTHHDERIRGLEVGANYYLTKPFTQESLQRAIVKAFAWRDDLQRRGTTGEIHFHLRSDTRHLEELNRLLASLFFFSDLTNHQIKQMTMAVRELGANAIEWGHRNQVERLVTVTYRLDAEKITIAIQDTGPGFDPSNLAHAAQPDDPVSHLQTRQGLGIRDGGFGIMMARGLVDDLQYNETGNEVRLVKFFTRRDQSAE